MSVDMVAHTIQYILAPVVMISACAILQSGLLAHYTDLSSRLRLLNHERFELVMQLKANAPGSFLDESYESERIRMIDYQVPDFLHRHNMVRNSTLAIYVSTFFYILDMGVIGVSVLTNSDFAANIALFVFLAGLIALLYGLFLVTIEIRQSHQAIQYEVNHVMHLNSATQENPAKIIVTKTEKN